MKQQHSLLAYLATLSAIVVMTIAAALICIVVDAEKHLAQIIAALGFIGAAVTGLIGVIGTFRPRVSETTTTAVAETINVGEKP